MQGSLTGVQANKEYWTVSRGTAAQDLDITEKITQQTYSSHFCLSWSGRYGNLKYKVYFNIQALNVQFFKIIFLRFISDDWNGFWFHISRFSFMNVQNIVAKHNYLMGKKYLTTLIWSIQSLFCTDSFHCNQTKCSLFQNNS